MAPATTNASSTPEDFALARLITEGQEEPALDLEAAQEYYYSLDKAS